LRYFKHTYILVIFAFLLVGCKSTKFVPKGKYLLKKNTITINEGEKRRGDKVDVHKDDIAEIIRQQPNTEFLNFKLNLFLFNRIDSAKVANKRLEKNRKIRHTNSQRLRKQDKVNAKRIDKARSRGNTHYTEKIIFLKDTLSPSLFFREWLKYKIGEYPVVVDSALYLKSLEQIGMYLKSKGYYFQEVNSSIHWKRNRKAIIQYTIQTGRQFMIDSMYVDTKVIPCTNRLVLDLFNKYVENPANSLVGKPFDSEYLEEYRMKFTRYMKDNAVYGYSPSHITFLVYEEDRNEDLMKVTIGVQLADRMVPSAMDRETLVPKNYQKTYLKEIVFHIADTTFFEGNFKEQAEFRGLSLSRSYLPTLDTLFFSPLKKNSPDEVNLARSALFYFNGELFLKPELIEVQSLLEKEHLLTETGIELTQSRLQQLGLFQTVKCEIVEVPDSKYVVAHFYLIPVKKESFSIQPKLTTSNGYLGLTAGLNYSNNNLFKGAEKLTMGLTGGFQAQPAIFDDQINIINFKEVTTKFYQFELSPSLKLELPGLYPIKGSSLNKYRLGKTSLSAAYSFQKRDVFTKKIFQMNYLWKYMVGKNQTFHMGLPFASVIKFVSIKKSGDFETKLNELNDIFLWNTYSNQFIWQDWKLNFEIRNGQERKKQLFSFYYEGSLDLAGNLLSLFQKYQQADTAGVYEGQYRVFNLVYSQFARMDNELIYSHSLGKIRSINLRGVAGAGITYKNSNTSMPYDYSFFAGGSNDVRGWKARAVGPGSYKYYTDTGRTAIQLGDIRIAGSVEYRFQYSKFMKGAYFIDAGNIWTLREDDHRKGSQFSVNWYKELAISTGIGFRMDFDFFLLRFDFGFPIHAPALPQGERWLFQKHTQFRKEITDFEKLNPTMDRSKLDYFPFSPQLSFGIGYPF
jgi:outer membrane protein insertion porin family